MTIAIKKITSVLSIITLLASCNKSEQKADEKTDDSPNSNVIVMSGSDTEFHLVEELVKQFESGNQELEFSVSGGGSSIGIKDFLAGKSTVANSSRQMYPEEIEEAKSKGIDPVPVVFGIDAVAIVTNSRLGVDSLSLFQLRKIFRGEIKNWKDVGGPDLKITLFGRNSNSGTYAYMQDRVVQGAYCPSMNEMEESNMIVEAVISDKSGIGYVGTAYLMDQNGKPRPDLWAMYVYIEGDKSYSPYEMEAVRNGQYPLSRPLYHYINGKPTGDLYQFFEFELGERGQSIIRRYGYFPISDFYRELNRKRGIGTIQ